MDRRHGMWTGRSQEAGQTFHFQTQMHFLGLLAFSTTSHSTIAS